MADINPLDITIANKAIAEAIKKEVKKEIDDSIGVDTSFTHAPDLLDSIKGITDTNQQAGLFEKYLGILEEHQKVKNEALSKLVDNGIEKSNKIINNEIEKDNTRTSIFGNRPFIMFLMCFPIFIGIFVVTLSKSYVFASFIILMWYGMILALYFSQSDALNKLLQNFAKLRRQ